jgi:hypothetical protein
LDGGTIGKPSIVDPIAYVLVKILEDHLVLLVTGESYFNPAYNQDELADQCLLDWVWKACIE